MTAPLLALLMIVAILAGPVVAEAQDARVHRVGMLLQGSPQRVPMTGAIQAALQRLGYVEGRDVVFERRWAEGENARFRTLAVELVALNPDVIVADSTPAAIAVKEATTVIPIVMVNVSDPVGTGIVATLARPGGNVTGGTDFGMELAIKALELLHEIVPNTSRIAVLMSDNPVHPFQLELIQAAAKDLRLRILPTMVKTEADLATAYVSMANQEAGALIWLGGAPVSTTAQRDKIVDLSAKSRLPTLYPSRWIVDAGGLMSYGPSNDHKWEKAAVYVDKVLKGAKPADLPVEQPTKFELVINMKTVRKLGLSIPPSVLLRVNESIER